MILAMAEAPRFPHILFQARAAATWLRPKSWLSVQTAGVMLSVAKATKPQAAATAAALGSHGQSRYIASAAVLPKRKGRRRPQRSPNQRESASHHQPPKSIPRRPPPRASET